MTWTWQLEKEDGTVIAARELSKETWSQPGRRRELARRALAQPAAAGVDQVTLVEDGRVEYGPMSLHPAEE